MIEKTLNMLLVRIAVGIIIGIPLTVLAVVAGAHGLVLTYGGIVDGKYLLILFGIVTITGFMGISGAWLRLLKPSTVMSNKYRNVTRGMLFYGLASSVALSAWSIISEGMSVISLLLIVLSLGGTAFVHATPREKRGR